EVERSPAWRYGHGVMRTLPRLRGRRFITAGGVAAALGQVDRALELVGAPRARSRSGSAPSSGRGRAGTVVSTPESESGRPATASELAGLAQRIRDTLGPALSLPELPPVAVIVVSRDAARARRLLERLAETDYPEIEPILVDNASPGGEVARAAEGEARGGQAQAAKVLSLEHAANFAEASNRGAELAQSELL